MNAKNISIIVLIALAIGAYIYFHHPEDKTIESLRVQAQEARDREIQAQKDSETREDSLSEAIYRECLTTSTGKAGIRFDRQQKEAYECWKSELAKTNSGTVASASSEAPPTGIKQSKNVPSVERKSEKAKPSKEPTASYSTPVVTSNYWSAYDRAVKLITKWEGLRLKAYWDFSHCSIGYGFSSPCGKTITQKQADQMLSDRVHTDLAIIRSDFPNLDSNAQGSLASFKHNCPAGYESVRKNGLKWFNSWCKTAGGDRLNGLVKRRAEEWKFISQ